MPPRQVKFNDIDETLDRIVNLRDRPHDLRVSHKASGTLAKPHCSGTGIHQLCYTFQHRSRFEDEGRESDSAEIGAGSELRNNVHEHYGNIGQPKRSKAMSLCMNVRTIPLLGVDDGLIFGGIVS
jgi:hypothetical protein